MSRWLYMICFALIGSLASAQEFVFDIEVNTPNLQTADPKLFDELESRLKDFLSNRKWTNENYEEHERIRCNLIFTVKEELSTTVFAADVSIQAVRPVFGSNYETTVLNHLDKEVVFEFDQTTPLIFSENIYTDNLTSVLAFYAYYMLGMDYDTYMLYGGDTYFEKANEIINTLPGEQITNTRSGWSSKANGRNRYFMIENMLNPRSRPYRKAQYEYHRNGLDMMHSNVEEGKQAIVEALKNVETVSKDYVNSMIVQMFANAKAQEVTEIFAVASRTHKNEVYRIMTGLDPANRNKYIPIRR